MSIAEKTDKSQDHRLLDAAIAYAAKGWHVFPCHTPTETGCSCTKRAACTDIGKHPRTRNGLKDATTEDATIRHWWKMWPGANIAIRTGAVSGLVVLDVDFRKGGAESLGDLEQSYTPFPVTVLALTGNGEHYVFAHPGTHVKNGVEDLGPGLDIRGDGGYIIAAPSRHENGKRYAWEVLHEPDDTPLAPMPEWLRALCQETTHRTVPSAGDPIPDHQRNDTLFRLGASMRAKGFEEAAIFAALWETNQAQCQPPLTEAEVRKIAASDCRYEAGPLREEGYHRRNGETPAIAGTELPLPYSDYTNALAFVRDHGQHLRFCFPWNAWLVWTGTHWQRDTSGEVMRLAKQTVKRLARQIESLDETPAKALMAHIKASLSTAKLKALIENAQSEKGIAVQPDQLDQDPWVLNCTNGTLDLRTGALRPHAQPDLITKCLTIPYDPEARYPQWMAFLEKAMGGDAPLVLFLQRALGYALTGSTREQCFFLLHGPTKTGKSTFITAARALLGAYARQAEASTFLHKEKSEVRNDLAMLAGVRLVSAIETDKGKKLAEALVKQATGGTDAITARFLFEELFEFVPQFKVFLATNHAPKMDAQDDAIWERVHRIPFEVQIPKDKRDKELDAKLQGELPGILAWAVRGCLIWQQENDLRVPQRVTESTQELRDEMDDIGTFLRECCILGDPDTYKTQAKTLLDTYHRWTGNTTLTAKALSKALTDRHYASRHTKTGTFWFGIGIPAPEEDERYK
jgi:putative DNA primase/helicase